MHQKQGEREAGLPNHPNRSTDRAPGSPVGTFHAELCFLMVGVAPAVPFAERPQFCQKAWLLGAGAAGRLGGELPQGSFLETCKGGGAGTPRTASANRAARSGSLSRVWALGQWGAGASLVGSMLSGPLRRASGDAFGISKASSQYLSPGRGDHQNFASRPLLLCWDPELMDLKRQGVSRKPKHSHTLISMRVRVAQATGATHLSPRSSLSDATPGSLEMKYYLVMSRNGCRAPGGWSLCQIGPRLDLLLY